jgi:hypothetical protein
MKLWLGITVVGVFFVIAVVLWRGDQILADRFLIGRYQHVLADNSTELTQTELLTGLALAFKTFGLDTNSWAVSTNLDFGNINLPQRNVPFSVSVLIADRIRNQRIFARIESSGHTNMVEYTLNYAK